MLNVDRDMKVVEFLTDPVQMDRVINRLNTTPLGTGSSTGSSTGSGTGSSTKPTPVVPTR